MADFIRHTSCPQCGSRNNVGVWADGHERCFSPNCTYYKKGDGTVRDSIKNKPLLRLPPLTDITQSVRSITPATLRRYWIQIDDFAGGKEGAIAFVNFNLKNQPIGIKYRDIHKWEEKFFWYVGESIGLFGLHAADKTEGCIITEGEFDAAAAYEMYGFKYSAISIAHGASAAIKDLTPNIEYLEANFEVVFICFDNDDPGNTAADEAMELFRPGKARRVLLPSNYKDANEMLEDEAQELFRQAIDSAKCPTPSGFVDADELMSLSMLSRENPDFYKGASFGFEMFDLYTGGMKGDEIIVVAADTGVGKTALVRQLAYNLLVRNHKVCWLSLEMPPLRVLEQFVEVHTKRPYQIGGVLQMEEPEYQQAETFLLKQKHLHLYQNFGSMDVKKICSRIVHAHLVYGCKVFVIDHLAIMTSDKDWKEIDQLMSAINDVCIQYHLCIIAVAQFSHSGNIRGSKGIDQIASCVLTLERDYRTTVMKVKTSKPHRYCDVGYGEFYVRFDKGTRQYVSIQTKEAKETIANEIQKTYTEEEQAQQERRETLLTLIKQGVPESTTVFRQEPERELRTEDSVTQQQSTVDVRTNKADVDFDTYVPSRLFIHIQNRKSYLSGIERTLETGRQAQDISGNQTNGDRFETYVSKCEQPINSTTSFPNLWGMGNVKQN